MAYRPDTKLVYPWGYHPKASLELFLVSDNRFDIPDELRHRDLFTATARDLLTSYADSHLGRWHSGQAPRYPNFHRDLPEYAAPYTDEKRKSYQHTFGRIWLKSLVSYGHMGLVPGDNPDTVEERFPLIDVSEAIDPSDTQATDLHPVGHMARTSVMLHETLQRAEGSRFALNPFAAYLTRAAMALHDVGENEHPGVIVETGDIVGDISAAEGKTAANRLQERLIFESILREEFSDYFDEEMIEIMSALVGHRTHDLDPPFIAAHTVQEIAHNLNSARTGMFAANLGVVCADIMRIRNIDDENREGIHIVGHSMAMAEQHVKVLHRKFTEVADETPDLYRFYDEALISDTMQELEMRAHALDENEQFIDWRTSEPIVRRYGDYQPRA